MKRRVINTLILGVTLLTATNALAQKSSREELLSQIQSKRGELEALEKQFLAPSEEDRTAYSAYLSKTDRGLIRLLPREVYDTETYRNQKKSLTIRGAGAYYSFTRLTHEYLYGSDISLDSNYLGVGFAGFAYGILQNLGDVPLEGVTIDLPNAHFLATYIPPSFEPDLRVEQGRFGRGATVDDVLYKNRVPLEVNKTFLLRSISPEESDVLVAFRVVRKDTDGSAIIVWKLLKKYPKPEFARNN